MGRTGKLFAHEWAGIDAGRDVARPRASAAASRSAPSSRPRRWPATSVPARHGTTFGGNPLACAAGNAVLDVMLAPGFLDSVAEHAAGLRRDLESLAAEFPSVFEEVRGLGLLLGLKFAVSNTAGAGGLPRRGAADGRRRRQRAASGAAAGRHAPRIARRRSPCCAARWPPWPSRRSRPSERRVEGCAARCGERGAERRRVPGRGPGKYRRGSPAAPALPRPAGLRRRHAAPHAGDGGGLQGTSAASMPARSPAARSR